ADQLLEIVGKLEEEIHASGISPGLDMSLERDLGFDSLARVELALRIERAFGVHLPEEALVGAETPRDLLNALGPWQEPVRKGYAFESQADMSGLPIDAGTLVEVLDWHVAKHPDRIHIRFESSAGDVHISYGELRFGAENAAFGLVGRGVKKGDAVAIMLPTGPEYFHSFFGILMAGCVPVPIYPPFRPSQIEDHLKRHAGILMNARAVMMITFEDAIGIAKRLRLESGFLDSILTIDDLASEKQTLPLLQSGDTALLQYTSGSTGNPKGVVLSHANLLANIRAMGKAAMVDASDVFVSWLPLYHDMGLIGAWLGSLYHACAFVVMSPLSFLARPSNWLYSIARNKATLTASPNFGYALCLSKIGEREMEGIDLSSLRMAFNGAEPVSIEVIEAFEKKFGKYGLKQNAMTPVYGLAESSVGLAFTPAGRGARIDRVDRERFTRTGSAHPSEKGMGFVSCGLPLPGHEIRIVDGTGHEVGERQEGRLEFRGPSATSGYFRNDEENSRLFRGEWLDSGDYAYVAEGEIYPTGRAKDLIIRAGRNIYPYEAEEAVGNIAGIRRGCVAIFGVPGEGTERLIVVAEARKRDEVLEEAVRNRVIDVLGEPPDEILLVPPHTVLKTSSGKIRRAAIREFYLGGMKGGSGRFSRILAGFLPQSRQLIRLASSILYAARFWIVFWMIVPIAWLIAASSGNPEWNWKIGSRAARLFLFLSGVDLKVEGMENMRTPSVVAANHGSYLDGIVLIAALGCRAFRFVAKGELKNSFFSRIYLEHIGSEFVERSGLGKDAERLEDLAGSGQSMIFFPEGTFTRKPGLARFHMGGFLAAAKSGIPVLPVSVKGARSILRDGSWLPRRGKIEVTIGKPIHPEGKEWRHAVLLRDAARSGILEHCGEPDLR
ncbi:MAG TPA: AMP-binding protein, partial [Burkholderiales bacterium]|nr:AMP-binding protein [Burkholderiales bacterium]